MAAVTVRNIRKSFGDLEVIHGIRPEHLRPSGNRGGLGAKVIVVEPTGAADLAGEEVCAVTQDDEVGLVPLLDRVHLFDQATGKAGNRHG